MRMNVTQARTVSALFMVLRTKLDSPEGSGRLSGTTVSRMALSASRAAHHGIALKCARGSGTDWLCSLAAMGGLVARLVADIIAERWGIGIGRNMLHG